MNEAPLSEHLEALKRCVGSLFILLLCSIVACWVFSDALYNQLVPPVSPPFTEIKLARIINESDQIKWVNLPSGAVVEGKEVVSPFPVPPNAALDFSYPPSPLVCLSPMEGFFTSLKLAFWGALVLSSPFWLYILFQFVAPALHSREKKMALPAVLTLLITGVGGFYLAYSTVIPMATEYFHQVNALFGVNLWSLDAYVDYILMLYFCTILLLEVVALLLLLIVKGVIRHEHLAKKRKVVYLAAFILGAFLTPPDVFSQVIAASFLIVAFEGCLLCAYFLRT